MDELIQIIKLESCLMIYSYLMLFGKTTPAELREVTGQSKATMFRNLARLSEAGILKKEEVKSVEDKRYSLHYYISKNIMDMTKKLYSKKVAKYADSIGKSRNIREWASSIEALPYLLNQQTSHLILLMAQRPSSVEDSRCAVVSKFLVFRVEDLEKVGPLHKKLHAIVDSIDSKKDEKKRDWKQPLNHPVAISISVVSLNPEGLPTDTGIVVEMTEC
ncbi:MAG: MarR family transcriptional regulator [Candidatus Thorarchaeota archaeon]|jgi:predicted transcriptional regulator